MIKMSLLKLCQRFSSLIVNRPLQTPLSSVCSILRPYHQLIPQSTRKPCLPNLPQCTTMLETRRNKSLLQIHRKGPHNKSKPKSSHLAGRPFLRGIVLKVVIKKPKKPNSANRKCVRLRLSNGIERTAYIPGEGHNLQEHSIVLVKGGRLQDVPGVKLVCVRGKYDLAHVKKK